MIHFSHTPSSMILEEYFLSNHESSDEKNIEKEHSVTCYQQKRKGSQLQVLVPYDLLEKDFGIRWYHPQPPGKNFSVKSLLHPPSAAAALLSHLYQES